MFSRDRALDALGRAVVLNIIAAAGLWALGLRLILSGATGSRPLALAMISALVAGGVLAATE